MTKASSWTALPGRTARRNCASWWTWCASARRVSQPPIGPIGLYVKLKEEYWADAVEETIGQGLGSWLVGNMSDRDVLNKMIKHDCQMQGVTIVSMNVRRDRYYLERNAAQRPPKSFKTMLDVLEFENDAVFNNVVDTSQVERVVLVEKPEHGHGRRREARERRRGVTKDRKIAKRGNTRMDTAFRFNLREALRGQKGGHDAQGGHRRCKKQLAVLTQNLAAARERATASRARGGPPRGARRARRAEPRPGGSGGARAAADEDLGVAGVDVRELETELGESPRTSTALCAARARS